MPTRQGMRVLDNMYKKDPSFEHLARKSNFVPGMGPLEPQIIFIGEAPGSTEARLGAPFMGPSGKFLDKMLYSIGISRAEVWITNVVKFRPPNNRDPSPQEVEASLPYLREEVSQLSEGGCRTIAALGKHAACAVLQKDVSISRCHGDMWLRHGWSIFTLYHPAVALYNTAMEKTLFEDFSHLKEVL